MIQLVWENPTGHEAGRDSPMEKRHSADQIVAMLRQAVVELCKGLCVPEACKQLGASEQTYCRWRIPPAATVADRCSTSQGDQADVINREGGDRKRDY